MQLIVRKKKKASSMEKMNKALGIKPGAVYYMDGPKMRGEETAPKKVTVKEIYPHMIVVEDERGFRTGITAASAAVDLRKTKKKRKVSNTIPMEERR
jgi:hypothetical protein